tara:strand:- start:3664 stop:4185 length:522 start_codon:yes stop_codon:yes gene_type:complete
MPLPQSVLFIDEDYIKRYSTINGSVDPTFLEPRLIIAQDKWIQPILGTNLYQTIKAAIVADNLTTVQKTLLEDFIMRATLHWAILEILPSMLYKINNGALSTYSSEDSSPITRSELDRLVEEQRNNAQFYSERLIDYLCANSSLFPEYNTRTSNDQMCPIKGTVYYEGGMEIG